MTGAVWAQERQITFSAKNHMLDNNDNFSPDSRLLCYDTRETYGPGLDNCRSIEMVDIETGQETVLYAPESYIEGEQAAPGMGAASFSPAEHRVAFILGPSVEEVETRGYYGKPNRKGATVPADGSGKVTWIDYRDVETGRDTLPGAHRGGTHRHEYSMDGRRVGFTYDDYLQPEYDRTIGYCEVHPEAPGGATHWFALLVRVAPMGESKPGEIERAAGDSWVGRDGRMRAFIGKVRAENGVDYEESLFVADVSTTVDVTTADAGSASRYPSPPEGVTVRRLTHDWAGGIVRGTPDGTRIAYFGKADDGTTQVFIIASDGSDRHPDPAKRPIQATFFSEDVTEVRWHPSGNSIAVATGGGIAVVCVQPGPLFGKALFLTPKPDGPPRNQIVWSPCGTMLAFNRAMPTHDGAGNRVRTYDGSDFAQIFVVPFDDANNDGIPDALQ